MIIYTDTSALMKLILDEAGAADMRQAASGADGLVSAAIAYVEFRAAVAAAIRAQRIPAQLRDETTDAVERRWAAVSAVEIDDALLRSAGDAAERFALRGYDALHLAALTQSGSPAEVILACWDLDLRRAASELGYTLVPEHL